MSVFVDGSGSDEILCELDGSVGVITFNRPQALNAMTRELEAELHASLDRAVEDDAVRVIVLRGAGDRAFSAGYDLGTSPENHDAGSSLRYWWNLDTKNPAKQWHIVALDKPVIASVHGWCLAGAFWYTLACDVTIAADDTVFGQPEIRETQNSTALLTFLAGWKNAARYALTGDHFDAEEALRIGVVNEVVPRAELDQRTMELAKRMAMVPADSLRVNKRITAFAMEAMGVRTGLEGGGYLSTIVHAAAHDSPELQEMFEIREREGMAASLKARDDKFRPEPGGPRSKPRS